MKIAQIVVLGVAVIAAGGAAMLAVNLAQQSGDSEVKVVQAPVQKGEMVLVAQGDIPIGVSIAPEHLKWQEWPRSAMNDAYLSQSMDPEAMEKVVGSVARIKFFDGEPIRESKLVRTDKGFLAAILPAGMRAIAIGISADTSAGGFILPNDRVDVIMSRRIKSRRGESHDEFITETILENVRVLAIDQTIEEIDGKKTVVGSTATLELTPRQTEILTTSQQKADRLTLALRSLADSNEDSTNDAAHLLSDKNRSARGSVRLIKFGRASEVYSKR